MKNIFKTLVASLLLASTPVAAQSCDTCFDPCAMDWNMSVYADFLYWDHCESLLLPVNNNGGSTSHSYTPAWRIGVRVDDGSCWDMGANYLQYNNDAKNTVAGIGLRTDVKYKEANVEFGFNNGYECCDYSLRHFMGAKYASVDRGYSVVDGTATVAKAQFDFSGYGLYIGTEGRYDFCDWDVCCTPVHMAFVGRGSFGILRGNDKVSINSEDLVISGLKACTYVGTLDLFAGLAFSAEWSDCFSPELTIGYETHSFLSLRQPSLFAVNSANVGFGGLVVRFGVGF